MEFTLTLVDTNPRIVAAWRSAFRDEPGVEIVHGSILQEPADAWVVPTDARGSMSGGVGAVMKRHLGQGIEARVRAQIDADFGGRLPVGCATCVPTAGLAAPRGGPRPAYLISAATTAAPSEDNAESVSDAGHVSRAFAAAVQAVRLRNQSEPRSILSLSVPGLEGRTGGISPTICAEAIRSAYDLLCDRRFEDFATLRPALDARLCVNGCAPTPKLRSRGFLGAFV